MCNQSCLLVPHQCQKYNILRLALSMSYIFKLVVTKKIYFMRLYSIEILLLNVNHQNNSYGGFESYRSTTHDFFRNIIIQNSNKFLSTKYGSDIFLYIYGLLYITCNRKTYSAKPIHMKMQIL
jgi:hypothetical protein